MITLYGHRHSQPSRMVEILLKELDQSYEFHEIDFAGGETRQDHFLEINAAHTIPVIRVKEQGSGQEFTLYESHAICRYLCGKKASQHAVAWYPGETNLQRSALIDQYLDWHHANIRKFDLFHVILNIHLNPKAMLKLELSEMTLQPLQQQLLRGIAFLDKMIRENNSPNSDTPTLLGGNQVTIADLSAGCELQQIAAAGFTFGAFPSVEKWLAMLNHRPAFREVSSALNGLGTEIIEQSGEYLFLNVFSMSNNRSRM